MSTLQSRRLFALDHNFPQPLLATLATALPMAELVPIREIDSSYADLDDWALMRELYRHERGWDGLITNDDSMLSLAKEMTVLSQTGLTLVVAKGQGHNPIRAVGVLLCHLPHICHQTQKGVAQIWSLKVAQRAYEPVGSGNSDPLPSGNSAHPVVNQGRTVLADPSREGRDAGHAEASRDPGAASSRPQRGRGRAPDRKLTKKRRTRRR